MQYEKTAKRNPGRFAVAGQRANAPPFAEGLQAIFITRLQARASAPTCINTSLRAALKQHKIVKMFTIFTIEKLSCFYGKKIKKGR